MSVTTQSDEQREAENQAWNDYNRQTKNLSGSKYEEVEPWAWNKLQKRLLTIHKRKSKAA